ncbi:MULTISPECIES: ComEC/Rec2 family competence protein [Pacificibacter]|uniref:ComEC/Rec2 family competence protein n=1 Tax=Pacificibacter TaxID=1042323 RepID=UPI001C099CB6|nr:ComEC/Rec2 family competence protein [Pacificibacter sp. 1_MG-2023]MBU2935284.1 ComEC family competence protein [Pacificibacter marinus]MDO6615438.1 ComEC/Rec2 family competence protein [Pacificibacter sp. 1_MG-2023]
MTLFLRPLEWILDVFDGQRGRLFLWLPVVLGLGVALYFAAPYEPSQMSYVVLSVAALLSGLILIIIPAYYAPPFTFFLMISVGFLFAGFRAHDVAAPVLTYRYYGPVEGRVVKIDRSASEAVRLTLDQVILKNTDPSRTPDRVRVSLHGAQEYITPEPGLRVALTGHLSPPPSAADPTGFNFQRMAWFDRLGAVGYTRVPVLRAGPTDKGMSLVIHRLRQKLSLALQDRIAGQAGAFAAAILTGDRSGITAQTAENLRASNLSHLLAISGLHMGLLTGAVFAAVRGFLALIPFAFFYFPNKKIAAVCALIAGGLYLALSGWNVATERAYIMVSMMFVAVLFDRQAISLRAVAMAALLILLIRPEVLPEPGFQMSFAATTALVAVFSIVRRLNLMAHWPRWLSGALTVVLSSAVAGVATAPVAAAHFNRIADFGLIANVISVPVMGAVVMPSAVLAAVLTPLGLQWIPLMIMEPAIRWLLYVAGRVAQIEGAVTWIISPPPQTLPLIALGGLFVVLWRGRLQLLGLLPVVLGFVLWTSAERPNVLVSSDGGLVGRMTAEGRALNKSSGGRFAALSWLENDGDHPDQQAAAARPMPPLDLSGIRIVHVTGRGWQDRAAEACVTHDIVILNQIWENEWLKDCFMFDLSYINASGSLSFVAINEGITVTTALGEAGVRLWSAREFGRNQWAAAREIEAMRKRPVDGLTFLREGENVIWRKLEH